MDDQNQQMPGGMPPAPTMPTGDQGGTPMPSDPAPMPPAPADPAMPGEEKKDEMPGSNMGGAV